MKFFAPIILLAIAIGGFFWYIEPAWAAISDTKTTIVEYQAALAQASQAVTTKNNLVSEYNSFSQTQLAELSQFLPQTIDPVSFILGINTIATQYGGGLKSVSIADSSTDSGSAAGSSGSNGGSGSASSQPYSILSATVTTAMTYPNFVLFLKDLERNLPPTDITSLTFTPPTTGSIYTFSLTLQTYYLP